MIFPVLIIAISCLNLTHAFNQRIPKNNLQIAQQSVRNVLSTISVGSILLGFNTLVIAEEAKTKTKKPKVLETENGIKYIEVKKGEGNYPNDGDFVVINYTGFLQDGTLFDTTEGKGKKPLSFRVGKKQIIPGIEEVLKEMRAGGEVTCTIPSKFAYGARGVCIEGQGCLVPPNENLKYVIKLKNVAAGYQ